MGRKEKGRDKELIPPMKPRKPLKLESWMVIDNFRPPRMLGLEFTSSSAALMAILETLPLIVFSVKIAPILMTSGPEAASVDAPCKRIKASISQTRFIVGLCLKLIGE